MKIQTDIDMKNPSAEPRTYGDECAGCRGPDAADILRFQKAMRVITGKWKIDIICALIEGPVRFGALRRALPCVTQHMLTEQLKELEWHGIVIRRAYPEMPPRVEYELSQAGVDLVPIFRAMLAWSLQYEATLDAAAAPDRPAATGATIRHILR